MGLAPAYNNTSIPYGARVDTFYRSPTIGTGAFTGGANLGAYIAETVTLSRPAKVIERRDELGGPNGSVGVIDFVTGTATVQLATSATLQLRPGDCFNDTFDSSLGSEAFVVEEASQPEGQTEYKKQTIKFRKLY
jgi:hypothetical protein